MREVSQGTVLRIQTDYKRFYPLQPYDTYNDERKTGTGFLMAIGNRVWVVTAHHVVSHAVRVTATTPKHLDGEPRELVLRGCNPHLDVAILSGPDDLMRLPVFRGSETSHLTLGHGIYVLGHGKGTLRLHHTRGGISGRRGYPHNRWQTDAVVHPGNSGGPVLDEATGCVLGIITSGEDDVQSTNYFVGRDEAVRALSRALQGPTHIDLGYELDALFAPVDTHACGGLPGGALVVHALEDSALQPGDVVRAVHDGKQVCSLNAYMRVQTPTVCTFDTIDFRTLLDNVDAPTMGMRVRRAGEREERDVRVPLAASRVGAREIFVDCEPMPYVTMGGLVVVMLSKTHENNEDHTDGAVRRTLRNPDVALHSRPMISHVLSGSPFARHGAITLVRSLVVAVNNAPVKTLEDVWCEYLKPCSHVLLTLDNGARVGASQSNLKAYDKSSDPPAGMHVADRRTIATPRGRKRLRFQDEADC